MITDLNDLTDNNIILLESQFLRAASFSMCYIYLGKKNERPRGILLSFHFKWTRLSVVQIYASSSHMRYIWTSHIWTFNEQLSSSKVTCKPLKSSKPSYRYNGIRNNFTQLFNKKNLIYFPSQFIYFFFQIKNKILW